MNRSIQRRKSFKPEGSGPWLGRVVNYYDKSYMGGLEVALIRGAADSYQEISEPIPMRYMSPFFGITNHEWEGRDPKKFEDSQQSYGFWMVPPDIGTLVMCVFVGGDYTQGFWIGCVPERWQNRMVPGIAAEGLPATQISQEQKEIYGPTTTVFPVSEAVQASNQQKGNSPDQTENYPPIHPFANRLAQQGLLQDPVRGVTTSGARREIPSKVFGFSTPGPIDPNGKKATLTYAGETAQVPHNRLGGTTFVMDDGDEKGENELVRIRTRTGHQILLHNTKKLIYIGNSEGTAWLEMTERGKIDIYAADSISVHTEGDFNLRADRDVNIEAGAKINLHAFQGMKFLSKDLIEIGADGILSIVSKAKMHIDSDTLAITSQNDFRMYSKQWLQVSSDGIVHISGNDALNLSAQQNINIDKGNRGKVNTKTGKAFEAANALKPTTSTVAILPYNLKSIEANLANNVKASFGSFLNRVPMHEPWFQHESNYPSGLPLSDTAADPAVGSQGGSANSLDPTFQTNLELEIELAEVEADLSGSLTKAVSAGAITFTTRSGTRDRFEKTNTRLQAALVTCANYYRQKFGSALIISSTIRTKDEQQKLYDEWEKAGGARALNKTVYVPGYGNVSQPVNPRQAWPNQHSQGLAADIDAVAAEKLYSSGFLKKVGLIWGGTWKVPDRVHVSLANTVEE